VKPHYVLYKGHPERVGLVNGKKVVLVKVEGNGDLYNPHCSQCALYKLCGPLDLRTVGSPGSCLDLPKGVYKEVP